MIYGKAVPIMLEGSGAVNLTLREVAQRASDRNYAKDQIIPLSRGSAAVQVAGGEIEVSIGSLDHVPNAAEPPCEEGISVLDSPVFRRTKGNPDDAPSPQCAEDQPPLPFR